MLDFLAPLIIAEKIIRITAILLAAYLGKWFVLKLIQRTLSSLDHGISKELKKERAQTLGSVMANFAAFFIWGAALLTILTEFSVNITPLLAGLGILGLGVGFASQTLVRDYISGFFLLFENQFNVGDEIEVAGKKGWVEELSLRTTILKDAEGKTHIVPNSHISTVTRFPKSP